MQLNCEVSGRRVAHIFFSHISVVVFFTFKSRRRSLCLPHFADVLYGAVLLWKDGKDEI